jgi:C4-dicarboxylate transporter
MSRGEVPETQVTQRQIAQLETLAHWLDDVFRVPGTRLRFGLDGVIGLIPGVGDAATGALAAYLAVRAREMGLPMSVVLRMAANVGLDLAVGTIPVAGDVFDVAFKANRRNIELLKRELAKRAPPEMKNVTPER